jgi:hypothetical protein
MLNDDDRQLLANRLKKIRQYAVAEKRRQRKLRERRASLGGPRLEDFAQDVLLKPPPYCL